MSRCIQGNPSPQSTIKSVKQYLRFSFFLWHLKGENWLAQSESFGLEFCLCMHQHQTKVLTIHWGPSVSKHCVHDHGSNNLRGNTSCGCPRDSIWVFCYFRHVTVPQHIHIEVHHWPVSLPNQVSLQAFLHKWVKASLAYLPACLPFSLSGFLSVHIRGASKMISCFRLASEPLSQPRLCVC